MVVRDLLFLFCPCGCPILSVLCEGWVLALPLASCLLPLLFTGAPSFAAFAKGGPGHQPLACPERSRREPSPLLSRDDGEGPAFSFVGALLVYPEERRAAPTPAPVRQGRALPESRPPPDLTLSFRASRSAVSGQRGIGCYRLFCKRPGLPRTYCLCKGMASAMPKRNDKTNPSFCACPDAFYRGSFSCARSARTRSSAGRVGNNPVLNGVKQVEMKSPSLLKQVLRKTA